MRWVLRRSNIGTAGHRHTTLRQATDCKTSHYHHILGWEPTGALTHCPMQRRRSVHHPGRSCSNWGTLVNAFQRVSLSVDLSSSAAGSRHAITAGSLTSSLMSDCRMRSAWGPRRRRAVGFRAYMTRHAARLLGLARSADRSSREQTCRFFPVWRQVPGTVKNDPN